MRRGLFGRLGKLGLNHAIQPNVSPEPIFLTNWKIVGNSEVHTLPYPDGIVLPTGYKRCEYLTFDGSSYIRPNITPAYGIGVNFSFLTSTTGKSILGSRNSSYEASLLVGSISDTGIAIGYGKPIWTIQVPNLANGEKHSIILDSSQLKIDGVDYAFSGRQSFVQNIPILLGGLATGDSTFDSRCIVGNIYDTIFYDTQGELWHGIPCLDANDVPCLYDIVSQTAFYNQGSGSFTYKLYPQPTEIWSCGEYNPIDGKYHILVQPLGGSIADIALDAPLRKVNNVADTIEFPVALEAFTDADGNQIATTLPNDTILHIQNLYDYTQTLRTNISFNNNSQRSAEIKIIQTTGASYCGFSASLQSGNYYSSCLFKNEDAKPNIIYSNSGNSSKVSSSDYQKVSLLQSNVTTLRYSALNNPTGVWQEKDVFFVKDINILNIDAMFADCTDLKPASASDFEALFPNLGCIDRTNTAIDVIVKDGKLYKYVDTDGKVLVTRNIAFATFLDLLPTFIARNTSNANKYRWRVYDNNNIKLATASTTAYILCNMYVSKSPNDTYSCSDGISVSQGGGTHFLDIYDEECCLNTDATKLRNKIANINIAYELETPTTELVDAPQIEEADSYTCVISQGGKAVSWSSFTANYLAEAAIASITTVSNVSEYTKVIVDADDKILYGLKTDGTEYTPDLTGDIITIGSIIYDAQFIVDIVKTTL